MNSISDTTTLEISRFINIFRKNLLEQGFFEHTLYSSVHYKVKGIDSFQLKRDLFLRYGTEPDVWRIGEQYNKIFFIGSLFRKEKRITPIHNYEFKIVDFYIRGGSVVDILKVFLWLLDAVESGLHLPRLSKLEMACLPYENFQRNKLGKNKKRWIVVTGYPVWESFYDTLSETATNKFEIMFQNGKETMEIASAGIVGKNLNPTMFVKNERGLFKKEVFKKQFIGFGFGVERLIYLYRKSRV